MENLEKETIRLVERWEHYSEIVNLVGSFALYRLWAADEECFEKLWCNEENEPCLGFNHGYYKGTNAIKNLIKASRTHDLIKAECVKQAYPNLFQDKEPSDMLGVGKLWVDNYTTPLVHIAEDNKTAQGIWYVMGMHTDYASSGPETRHNWGWAAFDFIREESGWRIWHAILSTEANYRAGAKIACPDEPLPTVPGLEKIDQFTYPEPNVPCKVYESYYVKRPFVMFPALPHAYDTFANTTSYGI